MDFRKLEPQIYRLKHHGFQKFRPWSNVLKLQYIYRFSDPRIMNNKTVLLSFYAVLFYIDLSQSFLFILYYNSFTVYQSFFLSTKILPWKSNSGGMFNVLALSAVYREFDPLMCQTKKYKIGICCFSAKHSIFRGKSKDFG